MNVNKPYTYLFIYPFTPFIASRNTLSGMKCSKVQGLKGYQYHLPVEGIRKGFLFSQKSCIKR